MTEKAALRKKILEKTARLSDQYRLEAGREIAGLVLSTDEWRKSSGVMLYMSTLTEPDTSALISAAGSGKKEIFLPRCLPGYMLEAVPFHPGDTLKAGPYGIPEPCGAVGTKVPDLIVVPCVCATPEGKRLGHGAGYYDRFLSESRAFKMCLCFEALLLSDLPVNETDVRMDMVVTEERLIRCR